MALCSEFNTSTCSPEDYIIYSKNKTVRHILLKLKRISLKFKVITHVKPCIILNVQGIVNF
jgi:hypothetical protein